MNVSRLLFRLTLDFRMYVVGLYSWYFMDISMFVSCEQLCFHLCTNGFDAGVANLSWLGRDPTQTLWMRQDTEDPHLLKTAPAAILEDREVLLAAVQTMLYVYICYVL